jgi:hypothetical protein
MPAQLPANTILRPNADLQVKTRPEILAMKHLTSPISCAGWVLTLVTNNISGKIALNELGLFEKAVKRGRQGQVIEKNMRYAFKIDRFSRTSAYDSVISPNAPRRDCSLISASLRAHFCNQRVM